MGAVRIVLLLVLAATVTTAIPWPVSGVAEPETWCRADTGVLTSGSVVTGWNDARANGVTFNVNAINGAGADITTTASSASLNNRPAIVFHAGKTLLSNRRWSTQSYSVFAVARMTGGSNGRLVTSDVFADGEFIFGWFAGSEDTFYLPGGPNHFPGTAANTQTRMYSSQVLGGQTKIYKNGNLLYNDNSLSYVPVRLQLGGIGGSNSPQQWSNAEFAEVIAFERSLSDYEQALVHCYLAQRYAMSYYTTSCPPPAPPPTSPPKTAAPKTVAPTTASPITYCCPETVTTCAEIHSRCSTFSASLVSINAYCTAEGEPWCGVGVGIEASRDSCLRLASSCDGLLAGC